MYRLLLSVNAIQFLAILQHNTTSDTSSDASLDTNSDTNSDASLDTNSDTSSDASLDVIFIYMLIILHVKK